MVRNLPIGEYVRAKRSCSTTGNFFREVAVIDRRLKQRGYKNGLLNRTKGIVTNKTRHEYLYNKKGCESSTRDRPSTFVTTFSTKFNKVTNIINRYLLILYQDPALDTILRGGIQCVARKSQIDRQHAITYCLTSPGSKHMAQI